MQNDIFILSILRGDKMKMTEYINLYAYESNNKSDLLNVCNKYNISSDRIYWYNFTFYLDVFKDEI